MYVGKNELKHCQMNGNDRGINKHKNNTQKMLFRILNCRLALCFFAEHFALMVIW